jgi:hypothetical protein
VPQRSLRFDLRLAAGPPARQSRPAFDHHRHPIRAGRVQPRPVTWIPVGETWKVVLIGLGLGLLAVLYRDVRRFVRYFRGKVYRVTHPYYWYGRYYRRRRR